MEGIFFYYFSNEYLSNLFSAVNGKSKCSAIKLYPPGLYEHLVNFLFLIVKSILNVLNKILMKQDLKAWLGDKLFLQKAKLIFIISYGFRKMQAREIAQKVRFLSYLNICHVYDYSCPDTSSNSQLEQMSYKISVQGILTSEESLSSVPGQTLSIVIEPNTPPKGKFKNN